MWKTLPENPEDAEMRHGAVIDVMDRRAVSVRLNVFLSFPMAGSGVIEISHIGNNNGNPDLVCEKY